MKMDKHQNLKMDRKGATDDEGESFFLFVLFVVVVVVFLICSNFSWHYPIHNNDELIDLLLIIFFLKIFTHRLICSSLIDGLKWPVLKNHYDFSINHLGPVDRLC